MFTTPRLHPIVHTPRVISPYETISSLRRRLSRSRVRFATRLASRPPRPRRGVYPREHRVVSLVRLARDRIRLYRGFAFVPGSTGEIPRRRSPVAPRAEVGEGARRAPSRGDGGGVRDGATGVRNASANVWVHSADLAPPPRTESGRRPGQG